jgi:putative endonuclease
MANGLKNSPLDAHKSKTHVGRVAESKAAQFLIQKGYSVLSENYRWKRGEADLICMTPERAIVLVEVRSSAKVNGWLRYSINPRKIFHLTRTLEMYLIRKMPYYASYPRHIEVIWIEGKKITHWASPL